MIGLHGNGNHLNELLEIRAPKGLENIAQGSPWETIPLAGRPEGGARIEQRHRPVFLYSVRLRFWRPFRAHRNKQQTQGFYAFMPLRGADVSLLVLEYMS